jgi:hypothetical protein
LNALRHPRLQRGAGLRPAHKRRVKGAAGIARAVRGHFADGDSGQRRGSHRAYDAEKSPLAGITIADGLPPFRLRDYSTRK